MSNSAPQGRTYFLDAFIADSTTQTRKGLPPAARGSTRFQGPAPDDEEATAQTLTPYHQKVSYALKHNIDQFFARHDVRNVLFLTLTFAEDLSAREASRRLRNFKEGILRPLFNGWIGILERTKRNRIHFHLLLSTHEDLQTGFDFDALTEAQQLAAQKAYGPAHRAATRRYSESASPALRSLWRLFRSKGPEYGFGRIEATPIRTNGEACAFYVGKYVAKHVGQRRPDDLRAKTILASQECRRNTTRLAWNSPGAKCWREALARVARCLGCPSYEDLSLIHGPRWAHKLGDAIFAEARRLESLT